MDLLGKHILVTGGRTGFLGVNFVNRLLKEGAIVYASSFNTSKLSKLQPTTNLFEFTCNLKGTVEFPESIEYVVHCAGNSYNFQELAGGSEKILDNAVLHSSFVQSLLNASGIKKVVFFSSIIGYPKTAGLIFEGKGFEGNPPDPYFGLGWINRFAEKMFEYYHRVSGVDIIIIRTSGVYGPYDKFGSKLSRVIPSLIYKFLQAGPQIEVLGSPQTFKDHVFIEDLVEGSLTALDRVSGFEVFNLTSGNSISLKSVVNCLKKLLQYEGKIVYEGSSAAPPVLIDVSKAKKLLDYRTTPLEEGLLRTIEWYKLNGS